MSWGRTHAPKHCVNLVAKHETYDMTAPLSHYAVTWYICGTVHLSSSSFWSSRNHFKMMNVPLYDLLLKGGHRLFSVRNNLSACCSHKGDRETGTDEFVQASTLKNWRKSLTWPWQGVKPMLAALHMSTVQRIRPLGHDRPLSVRCEKRFVNVFFLMNFVHAATRHGAVWRFVVAISLNQSAVFCMLTKCGMCFCWCDLGCRFKNKTKNNLLMLKGSLLCLFVTNCAQHESSSSHKIFRSRLSTRQGQERRNGKTAT